LLSRAIRVLLTVALSAGLVVHGASAATPLISVKPMSLIARVDAGESAQGILVKKSIVYVFGTTGVDASTASGTSDGFVRAFDKAGTQLWNVALDTGGDDIATAAALDPFGNIWVAGSSALPSQASDPVNSSASFALNPDSVTAVPKIPLRADPNLVTTWLISPSGELISTFSKDVGRSVLIKGISASAATISVVGVALTTLGSAGFFIQSTRRGVFGKLSIIGQRNTEINAIVKSGKNLLLLGSSSETLFGKTRSGIRDAIIARYTSEGTFVSILRSFNTGASRTWQSGTSTYLISGDAIVGSKSEAVLTKYTSAFSPTWTVRYPSSGPAVTVDSTSGHITAFSSSSAITGIKSWKPSKPQVISLAFDRSGRITGAFSAKGMVSPIFVGYSAELGAVLLARGPAGVSIFHALTR